MVTTHDKNLNKIIEEIQDFILSEFNDEDTLEYIDTWCDFPQLKIDCHFQNVFPNDDDSLEPIPEKISVLVYQSFVDKETKERLTDTSDCLYKFVATLNTSNISLERCI